MNENPRAIVEEQIRWLETFAGLKIGDAPVLCNGLRSIADKLRGSLPVIPKYHEPGRRPARHVDSPFRKQLEGYEKNIIIRALIKCRWNRTWTARYLGIARTTLYQRMRAYGITNRGASDFG